MVSRKHSSVSRRTEIPQEPEDFHGADGKTFVRVTFFLSALIFHIHRLGNSFLLRPPKVRVVIGLLALVLTLDYFVAYPKGFIRLSWFKPTPRYVNEKCGWDYEAGWKIGIMAGTSPATLSFPDSSPQSDSNRNPINPIITCATVTDVNASFVADPFLIIPDRLSIAHAGGEVNSDSGSVASALKKTTRSKLQSVHNGRWYVFFEQKSLERYIGELGVAMSEDKGKTWRGLGTVLTESFHLSYPHIKFHAPTEQFIMIPETGDSKEVRIYTTSIDEFPFGWKLSRTVLKGSQYVDTSAVWYEDRWWIFTTVKGTLSLYHTPDLLTGEWTEHPSSPLYTHDKHLGRSGGSPVVHDGYIFRFAQDFSNYYGEKTHVMRVTEISETAFKEQSVHTMSCKSEKWCRNHLHHVDAHSLGETETAEAVGGALPGSTWVAVVDGDETPDDFQWLLREGWWCTVKRVFLTCSLALAFILLLCHLLPRSHFDALRYRYSPLPVMEVRLAPVSEDLGERIGAALRCFWPLCLKPLLLTVLTLRLYFSPWNRSMIVLFPLSVLAAAAFVSLPFVTPILCCYDCHIDSPRLIHEAGNATYKNLDEFVVVSAASKGFFDRLENIVGSIHFWEPYQKIVVYDLGLSQSQRDAMSCWEDVELRPFNVHAFPKHVSSLWNYAWKILLIEEALKSYSSVLVLDAGLELRQPITSIKRQLDKHGYFNTNQPGYVLEDTHPVTMEKLGIEDTEYYRDKRICSGGIQGYVRDSDGYRNIQKKAVDCAMDPHCITPSHPRKKHAYDQAVVSALLYKHGYKCTDEDIYAQWFMGLLTPDETTYNDVVLGLRRYMPSKPYKKFIKTKLGCNPKNPGVMTLTHNPEIVESHPVYSEDAVKNCLIDHEYEVSACKTLIDAAASKRAAERGFSWLSSVLQLKVLWKGTRFLAYRAFGCVSTYVLAFCLSLLIKYRLSKSGGKGLLGDLRARDEAARYRAE